MYVTHISKLSSLRIESFAKGRKAIDFIPIMLILLSPHSRVNISWRHRNISHKSNNGDEEEEKKPGQKQG